MNKTLKTIGYISIIPLLIGLFFFSNIKGYYRFKKLCEIEKNTQVIGKVEPNMGWIYNEGVPTTPPSVFTLASLPHVKFVRFKDYDDKQLYDARYLGGRIYSKESFEVKLADLMQKPTYAWRYDSSQIPGELRTGRFGVTIIDLRTKEIVLRLTDISYSQFDRNRTLLDAPSVAFCDWYDLKWYNKNIQFAFNSDQK